MVWATIEFGLLTHCHWNYTLTRLQSAAVQCSDVQVCGAANARNLMSNYNVNFLTCFFKWCILHLLSEKKKPQNGIFLLNRLT
jgi:hypothetical protein